MTYSYRSHGFGGGFSTLKCEEEKFINTLTRYFTMDSWTAYTFMYLTSSPNSENSMHKKIKFVVVYSYLSVLHSYITQANYYTDSKSYSNVM